jgi:hypothetical protein
MHLLRDELNDIQVTISSDYSPDLAEALVGGRLDVALLRVGATSPGDARVGWKRASHKFAISCFARTTPAIEQVRAPGA